MTTKMTGLQIHNARKNDPYDWTRLTSQVQGMLIQAEAEKIQMVAMPLTAFPKFKEHANLNYVLDELNDWRLSELSTLSQISHDWFASDGTHFDYVLFIRCPEARQTMRTFDAETNKLVDARMLSSSTIIMPKDFELFDTEIAE
ncbi:hypothetical protein YOLOSWAG_307 [Erwinia phage vB_EamM_Yoloswag]|uniref:Uncharacterized protein n=1 Tax=Erwinia phage vB_EamM_Yoloswag TaxID=1958956 RepID=A0A1S6L3M4_9CAUD|nr:hypothetical protein HOR66_gp307 [Erwinia phage vB_EamM_Yoloswag]AQT28777.1 hypothetical protein YOLOSWAG_307 [Erwinia phage vB_EamM_Yoloswag]